MTTSRQRSSEDQHVPVGGGTGTVSAAHWHEDVLGPGFRGQVIDLGEDEEGELRAVAIHHLPDSITPQDAASRIPLLLIHGWSDYILDREFLEFCTSEGFDVWGVDLRKHGRSLLSGQTPTAVDDLHDYDLELTAMLALIGVDRPPVLVAHSMGGLTATLWALRRPETVRGLVLNSPWLEFHAGAGFRQMVRPALRAVARAAPAAQVLPRGNSHYARTIHALYDGDADYSLRWKPPRGHPFPASTLSAVLEGQSQLRAAGALEVPALVLRSSRSNFSRRYRPQLSEADIVLNVRTMAQAIRRLGPLVRDVPLDGARHDVLLSSPPVRHQVLQEIRSWLEDLESGALTMDRPGAFRRPQDVAGEAEVRDDRHSPGTP